MPKRFHIYRQFGHIFANRLVTTQTTQRITTEVFQPSITLNATFFKKCNSSFGLNRSATQCSVHKVLRFLFFESCWVGQWYGILPPLTLNAHSNGQITSQFMGSLYWNVFHDVLINRTWRLHAGRSLVFRGDFYSSRNNFRQTGSVDVFSVHGWNTRWKMYSRRAVGSQLLTSPVFGAVVSCLKSIHIILVNKNLSTLIRLRIRNIGHFIITSEVNRTKKFRLNWCEKLNCWKCRISVLFTWRASLSSSKSSLLILVSCVYAFGISNKSNQQGYRPTPKVEQSCEGRPNRLFPNRLLRPTDRRPTDCYAQPIVAQPIVIAKFSHNRLSPNRLW